MANSHHAKDSQKVDDKSNVVGTFDQVAKAIALVLGGLYVLGLVISNLMLQRLGASDFSILQPRCIATGVLFCLYLMFAMLLVIPVVGLFASPLVFALNESLSQRRTLFFILIAVCPVAEFFFLMMASILYGGLTPWSVWPSPEQPLVSLLNQMQLAWSMFGHVWTAFTAIVCVAWIAYMIAYLYEGYQNSQPHGERVGLFKLIEEHPLLVLWGFSIPLVVFTYAVPGFARDVYPNLGQSVGGGQPIVARLQISGTLPLIEDGKIFRRVTESTLAKEPKSFVFTEPLVIWYQSTSFMYITPLAVKDSRHLPIALDAKLVQIVQQVAHAVEVLDGTRIIAVHDLP